MLLPSKLPRRSGLSPTSRDPQHQVINCLTAVTGEITATKAGAGDPLLSGQRIASHRSRNRPIVATPQSVSSAGFSAAFPVPWVDSSGGGDDRDPGGRRSVDQSLGSDHTRFIADHPRQVKAASTPCRPMCCRSPRHDVKLSKPQIVSPVSSRTRATRMSSLSGARGYGAR